MIRTENITLLAIKLRFILNFSSVKEHKKEEYSSPNAVEKWSNTFQWSNENGKQEKREQADKRQSKNQQTVDRIDFKEYPFHEKAKIGKMIA